MKIKKIIDAISGDYECDPYKHLPKVNEFIFNFKWALIYINRRKGIGWKISCFYNCNDYIFNFKEKKFIPEISYTLRIGGLYHKNYYTFNLFDCLDIIDELEKNENCYRDIFCN